MEKNLCEETFWEKAAKTRMGRYLTRVETRFVSGAINQSRRYAILDIGAGAGKFSLLAAEKNATVVSIDIVSQYLKRVKVVNKNVNVIQADARRIPLKDETFDGAFMIEVLDYISELGDVLGECHRTLKFNAPFVFSFGNKSSLKQKLRELRGKSYMHSYSVVIERLYKKGVEVKRKLGFSWLPFGRTSESRLVPFFATIEKLFALRRIPSVSPWVMVHAAKSR